MYKQFLLTSLGLSMLLSNCSEEKPERGKPDILMSSDASPLRNLGGLGAADPDSLRYKLISYSLIEEGEVTYPDYEIEAIMYFDSMYFSAFLGKLNDPLLRLQESPKDKRPQKDQFNFSWLNQEIKNELSADTIGWSGDAMHVLGPNVRGYVWILDHKILYHQVYKP